VRTAIVTWVSGDGLTGAAGEAGRLGQGFIQGLIDAITNAIPDLVSSLSDAVGGALGKIGSAAMSGFSTGLASGGQRGGSAGGGTIPQVVGGVLSQMGLSADAIAAYCGPLAAEAISRGLGKAVDIGTLTQDALKAGWSFAGMGGTGAFQRLLGM